LVICNSKEILIQTLQAMFLYKLLYLKNMQA